MVLFCRKVIAPTQKHRVTLLKATRAKWTFRRVHETSYIIYWFVGREHCRRLLEWLRRNRNNGDFFFLHYLRCVKYPIWKGFLFFRIITFAIVMALTLASVSSMPNNIKLSSKEINNNMWISPRDCCVSAGPEEVHHSRLASTFLIKGISSDCF